MGDENNKHLKEVVQDETISSENRISEIEIEKIHREIDEISDNVSELSNELKKKSVTRWIFELIEIIGLALAIFAIVFSVCSYNSRIKSLKTAVRRELCADYSNCLLSFYKSVDIPKNDEIVGIYEEVSYMLDSLKDSKGAREILEENKNLIERDGKDFDKLYYELYFSCSYAIDDDLKNQKVHLDNASRINISTEFRPIFLIAKALYYISVDHTKARKILNEIRDGISPIAYNASPLIQRMDSYLKAWEE